MHGTTQVYCVNWNVVRRNTFLTGSWDDSIKLWDLNSPASLATFKEHTYCVYAATWYAPWLNCGTCIRMLVQRTIARSSGICNSA